MFEVLFSPEGEKTMALRFTLAGSSNLVEFLRSFGFTREKARTIVRNVEKGRYPPLLLPSFDTLHLKLL
jgi:hypothetical protein